MSMEYEYPSRTLSTLSEDDARPTEELGLPQDLTDQHSEGYFTAAEQWILTETINNGADVRQEGGIVQCANIGDAQGLWLLLQRGADVEARSIVDDDGYGPPISALEAAAAQGYLDVCQILLDHGAILNPSSAPSTALHAAIAGSRGFSFAAITRGTAAESADREDVVRFFLEAGANPNCQFHASDCFTPLQAAVQRGLLAIGELLVAHGATIDAYSPVYGSALQTAIERRRTDFIDFLLQQGASYNLPANPRGSCLALAALKSGYNLKDVPMEGLMHDLMDMGADVNNDGGTSGSALQVAVSNCGKDVIVRLLDLGANVNATGGETGSVLHAAAHRVAFEKRPGHSENDRTGMDILKLLLDRGADINIDGINEYGKNYPVKGRGTVIQWAAFYEHIEIVELLLERQARLDRLPHEWGGVLAAAASAGYRSTAESARWLKVVNHVLDQGARINDDDAECGTALMNAAFWGNFELVKTLIDRGANVNAKSRSRHGSPLQAAAESGDYDMIKLLLDSGGDINICAGSDTSIIAHAVTYPRIEQSKRAINLLVQHGARIDDQKGSALRQAVLEGSPEVITFLLDKGADINHKERDADSLRLALRHCRRSGVREQLRALLKSRGALGVDQPPARIGSSYSQEKSNPVDAGVLPTAPLNDILGDLHIATSLEEPKPSPSTTLPGIQAEDQSDMYKQIRILGSGSAGSVDIVSCDRSAASEGPQIYARKMFWHSSKRNVNENQHQKATNEIQIIQRLRHHHMVQFVAAYQSGNQVGIIMSPVADLDLAKYLSSSKDFTAADIEHLAGWFGCLAAGLAYLHAQGIRHKDIKPANILIKDGNILYADFNISRAFKIEVPKHRLERDEDYDHMASKSAGFSEKTPMYCAPEVAAELPRGRKADIFSLGCVFLEMITVMCGQSLFDLAHYRINYASQRAYHTNFTRNVQWIFMLAGQLYLDRADDGGKTGAMLDAPDALIADYVLSEALDARFLPLEWCFSMLQPKDDLRISSENLLRTIRAWEIQRQRRMRASDSPNGTPLPHIKSCCSVSAEQLAEATGAGELENSVGVHLLERWPLVKPDFKHGERFHCEDNVPFVPQEVNRYCGYVSPTQRPSNHSITTKEP